MWVFQDKHYQDILSYRRRLVPTIEDNHPHITFAHYIGLDEDKLIKHTDAFVKNIKQFKVRFVDYKEFLNTLVLLVPYENEIKKYYELFHIKYKEFLNPFTKTNGNYIPHTTLFVGEDVIEKVKNTFYPFEALVSRVDISLIKEQGFEVLKTYELEKGE